MKKRILIIEDEAAVANYVGVYLNQEGFELEQARNITDGFARVQERNFDLIVLDLMLPDGTGDELLPKLRELAPHTPVLIMTGAPHDDERLLRCLKSGAVGYVPKSFRVDQLLSGIRRALRE